VAKGSGESVGADGWRAGPAPTDPTGEEAEADLALVRRLQAGDATAWEPLLARRESQIYATCRRMVTDPETARDLTQDVLVRLIEKIGDFDNRARFSTWMTRITINHCISHLRKQRLRRHASLESPVRGSDGASPGTLGGGLEQTVNRGRRRASNRQSPPGWWRGRCGRSTPSTRRS